MRPDSGTTLREQFTVGVEEEYQLIDADTGEVRSRGPDVRHADRTGEVGGEVKDSMLEITTPICHDAAQLAERLAERRFQASAAAATDELEILAAGTHPFSHAANQSISKETRPQMLSGIFRDLLRHFTVWGMHVHVAVPPELDRVQLMNTVRTFGPHLLALSCSSPFHQGTDTGYASFRTVLWRGFPFVGVPPRFAGAAEYRAYVDLLIQAGTIPDERTLYWSVRPSARYPTLELRMCDACPRLDEAVAIAALARAVVVGSAEGRIEPIGASLSGSLQDVVLRENEWMVARDGLDATLIVPEQPGRRVSVRTAIADLTDAVMPVAQRLGDAEAVGAVRRIVESGNAADRLRRRARGGDSMRSIMTWLIEETRMGTGIDRRTRVRDASTRHERDHVTYDRP